MRRRSHEEVLGIALLRTWRRQFPAALQNPAERLIWSDTTDAAILAPGETLLRVRWECRFQYRYFADQGPGYDAFGTFVAGCGLMLASAVPPTFGPVTSPTFDWLSTKLLSVDPQAVPPTPGTSSFVDAVYATGGMDTDTESRRRHSGLGNQIAFVAVEPAFLPQELPDGAFSGSFWINILVGIP